MQEEFVGSRKPGLQADMQQQFTLLKALDRHKIAQGFRILSGSNLDSLRIADKHSWLLILL